jgi:hypothetical protein
LFEFPIPPFATARKRSTPDSEANLVWKLMARLTSVMMANGRI